MRDRDTRKRMPSTVAEGIVGRPFAWVVVVGNGAMAVMGLGSVALALRDGASAAQLLIFGTLAVAWAATAWYLAVLLVLRPRHAVGDLSSASENGGRGLVVPGSATSSVAATFTASAWAVAALSGSVVTRGGWRTLLVALTVGLAAAAVDQGGAARQRRFLVLTPDAVEAGVSAVRRVWPGKTSAPSRSARGTAVTWSFEFKPATARHRGVACRGTRSTGPARGAISSRYLSPSTPCCLA